YGLVNHATSGVMIARQIAGSGTPADSAGPAVLPAPQMQTQALQYAGAARNAENDALLLYSGIALGIMAVASVALGWFAAGRALRPLRRITAGARRIAATNLHERLPPHRPGDHPPAPPGP